MSDPDPWPKWEPTRRVTGSPPGPANPPRILDLPCAICNGTGNGIKTVYEVQLRCVACNGGTVYIRRTDLPDIPTAQARSRDGKDPPAAPLPDVQPTRDLDPQGKRAA